MTARNSDHVSITTSCCMILLPSIWSFVSAYRTSQISMPHLIGTEYRHIRFFSSLIESREIYT